MLMYRSWVSLSLTLILLTASGPLARARSRDDDLKPRPLALPNDSPATKRAVAQYNRKDYWGATISFHKIATDKKVRRWDREKAGYYLAKAFFRLGLYSEALNQVDAIVVKGGTHSQFRNGLNVLVALRRKFPRLQAVLKLIGKYTNAVVGLPYLGRYKHELSFYKGRFSYYQASAGAFKNAIKVLAKIPVSSKFYLRARFFTGMTHTRLGRPAQAVKAFKQVLRAARGLKKPTAGDRRVVLGAKLGLARTFYQAGQFATGLARSRNPSLEQQLNPRQVSPRTARRMFRLSLKYYATVPGGARSWPQARFEETWADFMIATSTNRRSKRRAAASQRALASIELLSSPWLLHQSSAEALLLRAYFHTVNCRYRDAARAVKIFRKRYRPIRNAIRRMVRTHREDNDRFYRFSRKILRGRSGWTGAPARLARGMLDDPYHRQRFAWIEELDHELKVVSGAARSWRSSAVANTVQANLSMMKSLAEASAGRASRQRLKWLAHRLRDVSKSIEEIAYEIRAIQQGSDPSHAKRKRMTAGAPTMYDETNLWPGTGEYWSQEKGYYRFRQRYLCKRSKHLRRR